MVAYAEGQGGERYAVLDTGRHWTGFAPNERILSLWSDVRARARCVEQEGEERRMLALQLVDLEWKRRRGHRRDTLEKQRSRDSQYPARKTAGTPLGSPSSVLLQCFRSRGGLGSLP